MNSKAALAIAVQALWLSDMASTSKALGQLIVPNSSRFHLERLISRFAHDLPPGSVLLDAGAGRCQYRKHFTNRCYIATDRMHCVGFVYGKLDFLSDLQEIPVRDGKFDAVLISQVLAHVQRPQRVLDELARVLKPNGLLLFSNPLFFEENLEPQDYYRFTQYGLRLLLEESSLCIEELEWVEGYYGTLSYQLRSAFTHLPLLPKFQRRTLIALAAIVAGLVSKPFFLLASVCFARLDKVARIIDRGYLKNYYIIARK